MPEGNTIFCCTATGVLTCPTHRLPGGQERGIALGRVAALVVILGRRQDAVQVSFKIDRGPAWIRLRERVGEVPAERGPVTTLIACSRAIVEVWRSPA